MSKIICEVCGTSFPDTAAQCPICGTVHDKEVMGVDGEAEGREEREFVPVRGGRFSHANVKKRNAQMAREVPDDEEENDEEAVVATPRKKNRSGLVIGLLILAIALVAAAYFAIGYLQKNPGALDWFTKKPSEPVSSSVPVGTEPAQTTLPADTEPVATTQPVDLGVPCTGLKLSDTSLQFSDVGKAWMLGVDVEPLDTTDELVFTSSDENIVTVTDMGRVVAVAPGEASVWVICGDVVAECKVVCSFEVTVPPEETEPEETTTPAPQVDRVKLSHTDVTIKVGETFTITVKDVDSKLCTFSVGNNGVATVTEAGYVKGVGKGTTTITVTYNDMDATCIVRVR